MRTAARRPTTNPDAMDAAYDLGLERARAAQLEQELIEARARLNPPLRKKFWSWFWSILIFGGTIFIFYLVGEYRGLTAVQAPLPTAIVGRPTSLPAPTSDYGIAAYNEAQRERAEEANQEQGQEGQGQQVTPAPQEPAAAPAPTADEAAIEAWLAAPPSTQTPLPEPGEPGFADSFQDSGCSAMIGYLPGHPCYQKPGDD